MRASLLFYRVLAYVVGVGLIILVLVGVPLKYLADSPGVVAVVGPMHGFLYMVYLRGHGQPGLPGALVAGEDRAGHAGRDDPVPVVRGRAARSPRTSWPGKRPGRRHYVTQTPSSHTPNISTPGGQLDQHADADRDERGPGGVPGPAGLRSRANSAR